jgi:hypothetical protein
MHRAIIFCAALLAAAAAAAPPFALRMASGEQDLARYRENGANVAALSPRGGGLTQLATYAEVAPRALPPGHPLRVEIERSRKEFRDQIREASRLGLAVCISTDEIQIPTPVFDALRSSITRADDPRRVDIEKEEFWKIYRAKYREVLREFPEIAYVQVRTGENYSHLFDGYTGLLIAEKDFNTTRSDTYIRNMQRLIDETRRIVVDEFHRKLIWRTWDLGNHGFHASPAVYDRVFAGITHREGLIVSIKYTHTDFWRYNDFNPNIGRGGIEQIVEFQCAREYEGKGAFPDYVGEEHAAAMRYIRRRGAAGVAIWHFGGGWGGPHLKNDRWVRLNIYTTSRLARDPDLSPRRLAEEWAAQEFGAKAARRVADMLLLSDDCVLAFNYIAPYARRHEGWLPNRNILRDDIIRGEKQLGGEGGLRLLYEGSKDALDEACAEKRQAVELAARMLSMFDAARGEQPFVEARNSLVYLHSLATVMSHYVQGMFRYYQWKDTGAEPARREAREQLELWRKAWDGYRAEIPRLPGTASLYRSQNSQRPDSTEGAMESTCEAARQDLDQARR